MGVFPPKENALHQVFGTRGKAIVGVIHSKPLPGSPHYRGGPLEEVYAFAVAEGARYAAGGVHGLVVENHWDIPFAKPEDIGLETAAAMAVMADRVRAEVGLPVGINVLANGVECALAVAKASGATFVRSNQWVNAYVANEGFVEGAAPRAARYRALLRAEGVRFFADVHVKHGSHAIVADRSLGEQVLDAEFFDADALIATGQRTGGEAALAEIEEIKGAASLPVVGSGLTAKNAERILGIAAGAIHGWFTAYQGIPALIVTLAGLTAWRGVAQLLTQGYSISIDASTFLVWLGQGQVGPLPVPALIAVVVVILGWVVMNRTRYGQYITGIGSNEEAVRRAGVNTRLVKLSAYMLTGAAAALGGMIYAARLTSGSANAAVAFELEVIAAVVLGGTSIFGGRGTIIGAVLGALTIAVISNGLILMRVSAFAVPVVQGVVLLLAIWANTKVFARLGGGR